MADCVPVPTRTVFSTPQVVQTITTTIQEVITVPGRILTDTTVITECSGGPARQRFRRQDSTDGGATETVAADRCTQRTVYSTRTEDQPATLYSVREQVMTNPGNPVPIETQYSTSCRQSASIRDQTTATSSSTISHTISVTSGTGTLVGGTLSTSSSSPTPNVTTTHKTTNIGAIVGEAIAGVVALAIIAYLCQKCCKDKWDRHKIRRRKRRDDKKKKEEEKEKEKEKNEIDPDPEVGGNHPGNSGVAQTLNGGGVEYAQPSAPLPPGTSLPPHSPVVQAWGAANASAYSPGPSSPGQYGAVAGPSDPFATPASQQGQYNNYPRDSKASYFDPQVAQPTPSVAPDSSTSSRPLSDEKARLWAMENSPSPGATTSYFSSSPGPSLPIPNSPQPASPTTFTAGSPEVRPMSMPIAGASSSATPLSHGNNLEGPHSDEPPPPSYAEAGRVGSMYA